jgi:hypothetical protein
LELHQDSTTQLKQSMCVFHLDEFLSQTRLWKALWRQFTQCLQRPALNHVTSPKFAMTPNTALTVGKTLVNKKGICAMHTMQLISEHAAGKRTHSKNKKITDSYPECEALRKKAMVATTWLMNKKAKGRHDNVTKMVVSDGMKSGRIEMPNDIWAADEHHFNKSVKKFHWDWNKHWCDTPDDPSLEDEKLLDRAEKEALLFPLSLVIKLIQTDNFAVNSCSYMCVFCCFVNYAILCPGHVADVDKKIKHG